MLLLIAGCRFTAAELPLSIEGDAAPADAPPALSDAPPATDAPPPPDGALPDARRFDARIVDAPLTAIDAPPVRDAAVDAPGEGCTPPTAECDGDLGTVCETRLDSDNDCGACDRDCTRSGGDNHCVATAGGFDCEPTCDADHADCDGDPANGCELDVPGDLGEPDDLCPGVELPALDEGQVRFAERRILPADDIDVFAITLREDDEHLCTPGDPLAYTAVVTLSGPAGFRLRELADETQCSGATTTAGDEICFTWSGRCDLPMERTLFWKVDAAADATSCTPYGVTVRFCRAGTSCEDCGGS